MPNAPIKYFFSMSFDLDTTTVPPSEIPGGTRVHVNYKPDGAKIFTDPKKYKADWNYVPDPKLGDVAPGTKSQIVSELDKHKKVRTNIVNLLGSAERAGRKALSSQKWPGLHDTPGAAILSGADTIFVREDGVVVLNGRFTIRDVNGFLIGARVNGVVDLLDSLSTAKSGSEAYDAFVKGTEAPQGGAVKVHLPMQFEAAGALGSVAEFAASRYVLQSLGFWKYEQLARRQFVGIGKVDIEIAKPNPSWRATRIELDVCQLG